MTTTARPNASQITDDQLDALYADRDKLAGLLANKVNELVDERRHYRIAAQAVGRVRALHQPMRRGGRAICAHCSDWDGFRCRGVVADFPCATLRALDGGDAQQAREAACTHSGAPNSLSASHASHEPQSASETHSHAPHATPNPNTTRTDPK